MTKRIIRVGFLTQGVFYGGATRSLYLLIKSLASYSEFEFYLYTISIGSEEILNDLRKYVHKISEVKVNQINYHQAVRISYLRFLLSKGKDYSEFVSQLIYDKIDILHINTTIFPDIPPAIKNNKTNIKVVTHVRELIYKSNSKTIGKYVRDQIVNYSDKIIAISDNEASAFKNSSKIVTIPNPFDFSFTNKFSDFRKINNISDDTIIIMMSSHFYKPKGHLLFLCSINKILQKLDKTDKVCFIIVGVKSKTPFWKLIIKFLLFTRDYRNQIDRYIKKYKLGNSVRLFPYTKNIFNILSSADIVIRPANTGDPWGRDIIEAMAFAKPVIATGSSEFYVKNGKTGYLITPFDCNELSDKIIDLIKNPDRRKAFGEHGEVLIREKCNLDNYGNNIYLIYQDLLNKQATIT